jgi:tetratricopeptide (TPR) repeat protein
LSVFYPHVDVLPGWKVASAGATLAVISLLAIFLARKYPYVIVGWAWYVLSLFPVSGILQVGRQAMADRFTYVPLIGLFVVAVWGMSDITQRWRHRSILLSFLGGMTVTTCLILTWYQVGHWRNSVVLFRHALAVAEESDLVHNNLSSALARRGRFAEAIQHGERALRINPGNAWAHNNMGVALAGLYRFEEAFQHYTAAIRLKPEFASAHNNLGNLLARQGRYRAANGHYTKAINVNPNDAYAHNNLAHSLAALGKYQQAATHYDQALAILPSYDSARHGLKMVLSKLGQKD